ncbi:phosphate ABC transporter substrate-binding protein [Desulfomarina sp.]
MKGKLFFVLYVIALVFIVNGGSYAADLDMFRGQRGEINIAGGTAHIPVMKEAASRIMRLYPDIRISVAGGGSGVGIKQVGEGLVDIGNSGRKPGKEEIERYGLKLFKWGIDGVGIIVNPANRVRSLSEEQVQDIFAGRIVSWKDVGGENRKINLYTRDLASGTRAVFWKKALNKGTISQDADFVVSNGAMKAAVSQDPYGVGYVSVGYMDDSVAPVAINGVEPNLQNVKSGKFPIARGLFSNTRGEPTGLTKTFIDYLFSREGQEIVAQKGFVPVK